MQTTTDRVNIRIKPQLKKAAQDTASALGTDLSTVVNMFLSQFVRDKSIAFSLRDENGFTPEKARKLDEFIDRIDRGEEELMPFDSGEDFLSHLRSVAKK
ncbi:MAG TPA: type II toxin-antitoxin system RelB/DinJ family antitoxin [bacterium]|nr:type II toxin-antitoxin system RelB/DinJ family antitoxin [bacterium]